MKYMKTFRDKCIIEYLSNRNEDENYTVAIQTAGYWLHHANHAPLEEFDKMVAYMDVDDNSYYKQVREIIVKALNPEEVWKFLRRDEDLMKLYNNDPYFRKSIDHSICENMNVQDTLILALKIGYNAKNEVTINYTEHLKTCIRPIIIKKDGMIHGD